MHCSLPADPPAPYVLAHIPGSDFFDGTTPTHVPAPLSAYLDANVDAVRACQSC